MTEYIYTQDQINVIARGLAAVEIAAEGKITPQNRKMAEQMIKDADQALRAGRKVER